MGCANSAQFQNFRIGTEEMPKEMIAAFAMLKKAAALVNHALKKLDAKRTDAIITVCDEIFRRDAY